jgi:hypothetical protein
MPRCAAADATEPAAAAASANVLDESSWSNHTRLPCASAASRSNSGIVRIVVTVTRASTHDLPGVHEERLPGDARGPVGREEHDGLGDLAVGCHALQRHV